MTLWSNDWNTYKEVYDVSYDAIGYPQFLVYHNEEWVLVNADAFAPTAPWDEPEY